MFYRPEDGHGLPHDPFKAIVAPRPIGWISSRDAEGRANLAPYSFFNAVSDAPPMVMFSAMPQKEGTNEPKDSLLNIRETGVFGVNIVPAALADRMNVTSGVHPRGEDEFALAGLAPMPGRVLDVPLVAEAPAALECEAWKLVDLPGGATVVFGRVRGVHLKDAFLRDGILDVTLYRPLARLGYRDYCQVESLFSLNRPYQE